MAIDWVAWTVTAAFLMPAIALALRGSSLLVDYAIFLYVINREIRRVVDWSQGGLEYWAVSDLNAKELGDFARLYRD